MTSDNRFHLHFDCFSGISGNMVLGALLDLGLPLDDLQHGLNAISIDGYRLHVTKVHRGPIHATHVEVITQNQPAMPRSATHIRQMLSQSRLPEWVKTQALAVFERLANAEGIVHGEDPAHLHFHEVGAIDSLVDIVGGLIGFHLLGITRFTSSAVNMGTGTVQGTHGTLPVPAPAVAELAKGTPIFSEGPPRELTTPTGMALLTTLVHEFCALPALTPTQIGYGAGTANPQGWSNVLRLFLATVPPMEFATDQIIKLDTHIDDLNPQIYEVVMDRLFSCGAVDVTLTPLIMKRSRPGILLSAMVPTEHVGEVTHAIFQETSTIGLRTQVIHRVVLPRTIRTVQLRHGTVRVKRTVVGQHMKEQPEFEDCRVIAQESGRPVREVLEEVIRILNHG